MKNRFNEMRYLLFVLLLILPVFAGAQTRVYVTQDQPQQIRQFRGGVDALNYFRLPVQGGHSIPAGDSLWFVRVNPGDGNVYMWDGLTWKCVSCGSGGQFDTTHIYEQLALKLNISDTATMLLDYARVSRMLDSLSNHWTAIQGKQNQLNGTGFVKASGTTITYDNTVYVPETRTITINGSTQDLSANRSWTIPVPDTSSLRADIDANSDSILAHRTAINGKEPIISAGTTSQYWRGDKTWQAFPFIPDSADYWTRNDADTSLQNIRDEIDNLPAPPVTSVNGQTGNVVLQFMDTAYVSGDTIYAEKGGNTFVVGVMAGGGSLDTAAVSAIVADSLSGVIRQGGNAFGGAVEIGSNNNQNVKIEVNGSPQIELSGGGMITYGGASQFSLTASSNRLVHNAVLRHEWRVNSASSNQMAYSGNLGIGLPNNTSATARLQVIGESSVSGNAARVQNSSGAQIINMYNTGRISYGSHPNTGAGYTHFFTSILGERVAKFQSAGGTSGLTITSWYRSNGVPVLDIGVAGGGLHVSSPFYNRALINAVKPYPLTLSMDSTFVINIDTSGAISFPQMTGADTSLLAIDEIGYLVRLPNTFGSASFSGDATETTFTVAHGLGVIPRVVVVTPTSEDAAASYYVTNKTTTTFDIVFIAAPPLGTDNVTFDCIIKQ